MQKIFGNKKKCYHNWSCHALGQTINLKKKYKIGSCKHSDISTFSLHPLKSIKQEKVEPLQQTLMIFLKNNIISIHGMKKTKKTLGL